MNFHFAHSVSTLDIKRPPWWIVHAALACKFAQSVMFSCICALAHTAYIFNQALHTYRIRTCERLSRERCITCFIYSSMQSFSISLQSLSPERVDDVVRVKKTVLNFIEGVSNWNQSKWLWNGACEYAQKIAFIWWEVALNDEFIGWVVAQRSWSFADARTWDFIIKTFKISFHESNVLFCDSSACPTSLITIHSAFFVINNFQSIILTAIENIQRLESHLWIKLSGSVSWEVELGRLWIIKLTPSKIVFIILAVETLVWEDDAENKNISKSLAEFYYNSHEWRSINIRKESLQLQSSCVRRLLSINHTWLNQFLLAML